MNQIHPDNVFFSDIKKMNRSALSLAIKYLSYRPRTVFEVKTHIQKKGFNEKTIAYVLDYLKAQNYLDDKLYCKLYIEYRSRFKPKSVFAFKYELKLKGVDASLIDTMLSDYNDDELAANAVKPKIRHWQNFDDTKFNRKIMNYLKYRGFSYAVCMSTINRIKDNIKEENEN